MTHLPIKVFLTYVFGLASTFMGAWMTEISGSLLPLAMGGAASVMTTVPLVRAIRGARGIRSRHPDQQ